RECTQRTCWVRPIFTCERRFLQGASDNLIREMENEDVEKYVDYFRMPPQLFNKLLKLIEPNIIKQNVIHDPIPSHTRLQVTLRYLASGDSMKSLSYAFRIGHSTVSQIITETCHAIWNSLKNLVFITDDEGSWQGVADEFESLWNFPHCIGAIDGKHIAIQASPRSGSTYYNYKGHHSITLLAISDAKYNFTMVNIGAEGRQSDGGIFRSSEIGKRFEAQTFNIPQAKPLEPEGPALPFVLVADEAFPLSNYIMRPYPHNRYLDISKKVFNYRLSRARRVVESAFGILVAHWRIFRKPLIATVNNATLIVQAAIVLHNFILQSEEKLTGRKTYTHQLFQDPHETSNGIRDTTVHRGRSFGAIPFQWEKAIENNF
ncbi:putative nuclease HARBI1, partial [Mycetomoellerius zeteki]|uniref:putative nuclease HARBI1 n=1 Tax=Mycetomoellerius zeteki TaxID=64791 RepID=UPI00084ECB93